MYSYFRFNDDIYVEYNREIGVFRHWNFKTLVGRKHKFSAYIMSKLMSNNLTPCTKKEFGKRFDVIGALGWRKTPPIEHVHLEITVARQKSYERETKENDRWRPTRQS